MKVKAGGTTYGTLAEAIAALEQLEELREDEVSHLREQGQEAAADRRSDAYGREIARLRAAIQEAQEERAPQLREPKPKAPKKPAPTRRARARKAWSTRSRRSSGLGLRRGMSGRVLRETGATGATFSATRVALEVLGLIFGLALLLVVLENERPQGGPFSDLLGHSLKFLGWLVAPVDPFTGQSLNPPPPPPRQPRQPAPSRPGRPATSTPAVPI